MMMKNNVYRQQLPLWTARLISPVHVSDIGSAYSFDGKALWDTGAEVSVISRCVAEACRLKDFLLKGSVRDLTEEKEVKIGVVLVFPGNVRKYVPLSVAVLDDMHRDVDVILGMDIISRGNFSLNRHPEHLEFSFTFGPDFIDA